MITKPSLYDILNAEKFRERAYDSFGKSFAFWISSNGVYSKNIYFDSLESEFSKAQEKSCLDKSVDMMRDPNDIFKGCKKMAACWNQYALKKTYLLVKNMPASEPRLLVNVNYDLLSLEFRKYLLSKGHHRVDDYLSRSIVPTATDVLVMHVLQEINPVYLMVSHNDEQPAPAYFSALQIKHKLKGPVDAMLSGTCMNFAFMAHGIEGVKKAPVGFSFAALLLDPENGLVESPEEIKKELSVFT